MSATPSPSGTAQSGIVRCRKTVTPKKLEANRLNAKSSTGPRTEHGKRNSRFNAVALGLFARHVVIPVCDGDNAENEFRFLLDEMHQEFRPVGVYEEWLVVKIAECMWRLRRATRCESGAVRESGIAAYLPDDGDLIMKLATERSKLAQAEDQLLTSGTLSQKLYMEVVPLVEKARQQRIQSESENKLVETDFDRKEFLTCISDHKQFVESLFESVCRSDEDQSEARSDYKALLPGPDMDRVFRYEERMHRQIDWALQRLLESQERRKTVQSVPEHAALQAGHNGKRSQ
jgi:hypothetical protein